MMNHLQKERVEMAVNEEKNLKVKEKQKRVNAYKKMIINITNNYYEVL